MATAWSPLDPEEYPFIRSVAGRLRAHDDHVDFLAGLDLLPGGIRGGRWITDIAWGSEVALEV